MKWITRQGIRVNRTATCWFITRFLDPEAEFIFVPADQVASTQPDAFFVECRQLSPQRYPASL